jgi:tRNA pseudouridine55 synthase
VSLIDIREGGFLLIDKPLNWTSFDVVKKLRNVSRIKKIGHAGTLDPLASGLVIVCYGKYTKKIEGIQAQIKEYIGSFHLGKTTPSFDLETEVDGEFPTEHINTALLQSAAKLFLGDIEQVPPQHSAIKINGKRAYEHARKGEEVELKSRTLNISKFEIDDTTFPTVSFLVECSKGTYIRSLARDYGLALNSGAYLSSLRRTKIGEYDVENAIGPEKIGSQEDFFSFALQFPD